MNCFLIIMYHMLSGLFDVQGGHYIQNIGVEEELKKFLQWKFQICKTCFTKLNIICITY